MRIIDALKRARGAGPVLLAMLLVQACTVAPPRAPSAPPEILWEQRQARLAALDHWRLEGRIGFVSGKDSGSASLYWEQRGEHYELRVVAPLGRGSLRIEGSPEGVVLHTDEGDEWHSADAEYLLWERTGWIIPVTSLRYWIIGLPAGHNVLESYRLDPWGRLETLKHRTWQVQYDRYRQAGDVELPANVELPAKLQVQGPDLTIKVAVTDWDLSP